MTTRTLQLNSNFLPFLDVSTYHGIFSTDEMYNYEHGQMPSFIDSKSFNMDAYSNDIMHYTMCALWDEFLSEIGFVITYIDDSMEFNKPKAYNFADDYFTADVLVNVPQMMDRLHYHINNNRDTCEEFLDENWSSHSGFISFMPESIDELLVCDDLNKVLAFVLNIEYLVEYEDNFADYSISMIAHDEMKGNTCMYDYETFELNFARHAIQEYPLLKTFENELLCDIRSYVLNSRLATQTMIDNLIGMSYGETILRELGCGEEYIDSDMELLISDEETALFVILLANDKINIK